MELKQIRYCGDFDKIKLQNNDGQKGSFCGYASVYDVIDTQNDRVVRGAFAHNIAEWKQQNNLPMMLWQHDPTQVIGVWTNISENEHGLKVEGQLLLNIQKAREVYNLLQAQAIDGLSIGYKIIQAMKSVDQTSIRLLTNLDLLEISLVTFPANEQAVVQSVKSCSLSNI